jgi:chemotaxis family two-component system sensor kinase Cph1
MVEDVKVVSPSLLLLEDDPDVAITIAELLEERGFLVTIDGGSLQVQPKDSELGAIANDAVDLMRPLVEERKQQLVVDITPGLRVLADPERIIQVLSNILGNATKFTPVGGRISLWGAAIEQDGRRFVKVTVTDSGPGIARENLPRIFDRFWKSSQDRQGVGLGLAIAKGVVEAHGGRIGVDSPPGGGATFRFTLPVP